MSLFESSADGQIYTGVRLYDGATELGNLDSLLVQTMFTPVLRKNLNDLQWLTIALVFELIYTEMAMCRLIMIVWHP